MNKSVMSVISKRVPTGMTRAVYRKSLVLKKNSPHIFFVAGVVGTVTSTVLACRATLKLSETLDEIEHDMSAIKEMQTEANPRDDSDVRKDMVYIYAKSAGKLAKLYGPAVGVGVGSIGLLTGAHINLTRRNTALMAAYATVTKAFDEYRERVSLELGDERELDIHHAAEELETSEEDGVKVADPSKWSPYAKFFDEQNPNFTKDAEINRLFLTCQQNYANQLLQARGHLFLNEVYDSLGIEHTSAGSVVGWVIGDEGDNYVNFGLYEATSAQFINGWEPRVILDFNVDGVIYDKI
jgi:hypothetical protein